MVHELNDFLKLKFTALIFSTLLLLVSIGSPAAENAEANTVLSANTVSGVKVELESQLSPLAINQMHSWIVRVSDAQGKSLSNARVTVNGGMPDHDHGLPTQPQITEQIAPGAYRLEGVRFHMNGRWVMTVEVQLSGTAADEVEVVTMELFL